MARNKKIAYIMSRFPNLSETFILREMMELERHEWQISLYPLILQLQEVVHIESKPWIARAKKLPFISFQVLLVNLQTLVKHPFLSLELIGQVIWENKGNLDFLIRALALIPKAFLAAKFMKSEGISHIHAHYATHPALVAWIINRLTGISYSVTVHAHDIFVSQSMLKTKLQNADRIFAISDYNRKFLGRLMGDFIPQKTHIIHCGVLPENYQVTSMDFNCIKRLEIISIGSLQVYKGQRFLIDACAILKERGVPFRCRIIGEGEERSNLEIMIIDAQLENVVQLLGAQPQDKVAQLLSTAHCYVQPSIITSTGKMEGIPVSIMEALVCCLPVITTKISGIPELVRNDHTGYLVEPADAKALADAIESVYKDPQQAKSLAEDGRAAVLKDFQLSNNVKQLSKLFNEIIESKAKSSVPIDCNTMDSAKFI